MKIQYCALLITLALPLSMAASNTKEKRLKRRRVQDEPGPNVYLPRERTRVPPVESTSPPETMPPKTTTPKEDPTGGELPTAKLPLALPGTDDPVDSLMACMDKCSTAYLGNTLESDSFCRFFGLEGDDFDACVNAVNAVDSTLYGTSSDLLNAWCEQSICADKAAAELGNRSFKPPAPTDAPVVGTGVATNRLPKPPVTTTDGSATNRSPNTSGTPPPLSDFKKCMRPCVRYVRQQGASLNAKDFCTTFATESSAVSACVKKAKAINPLKFQVRGSLGGAWCRQVVCAEYA